MSLVKRIVLLSPLWSSLRRPPSLFESWAPSKRALSELRVAQLQLDEFLGWWWARSDTEFWVPQVAAVVAADGPGQAWVMLWDSQIISTWSRNEPQLQLDSYGLDGWQEPLSSSRCMVAPPSGRGLSCSLYLKKIGLFPWRDVITAKLSNHEPVIHSYPVSRDFNSLTAKRGIRSINFVQGTTPQRGNWKEGGGRGMIFLALSVLLHS